MKYSFVCCSSLHKRGRWKNCCLIHKSNMNMFEVTLEEKLNILENNWHKQRKLIILYYRNYYVDQSRVQ